MSQDLSTVSGEQASQIFDQKAYSIVINNAGRMNRDKFMEQSPETMQAMIDTNIRSDVLFSKYATLNFLKHADTHEHKVALIHTASIVSDLSLPFSSVYSGTKRFNEVFGELLSQ